MALDLNTLRHHADFNLTTISLGELRCGPLNSSDLDNFEKLARADGANGEFLARQLILLIARRHTGDSSVDAVCGGAELTESEVAGIERGELDDFCNQFIVRRLRTGPGEHSDRPQTDFELSGCDLLVGAIIEYADARAAQLQNIMGRSNKGFFASAIKSSNLLQRVSIPSSEILKSVRIGSALGEMRQHALKNSLIGAALQNIEASDKLGESLAALRDVPKFPSASTLSIPIPSNPIVKTNELLVKQFEHALQMRPVFIRSAELIQTLAETTLTMQAAANDNSAQAERHANRSMGVAIASVLIAVITSGFSIYYANASPSAKQADQLSQDLLAQLAAITAEAKNDRMAFEKNIKEDRALFAASLAEQATKPRGLKSKENKIKNAGQSERK